MTMPGTSFSSPNKDIDGKGKKNANIENPSFLGHFDGVKARSALNASG
jgi:hypothetical protein